MRSELDQPLRLEAMADVAALSVWHFARVFHHVTGLPPAQFLATLRLAEAKRLLLTTTLSVADVCFQVGYNSPGSFTTRFTESVGVSPGQFRRLRGGRATDSGRDTPDVTEGCGPERPCALGGQVVGGELDQQVFLGLFTSPIPEGLPVRCKHLATPGAFRLDNVPPGRYHLLAASVSTGESVACTESCHQIGGVGPIDVGIHGPEVIVRLRAAGPADPPVLLAIGPVLSRSANRREPSEAALSA
jgi:AraC-like DNA-binding protein